MMMLPDFESFLVFVILVIAWACVVEAIRRSWNNVPSLKVFITGIVVIVAVLFTIAWIKTQSDSSEMGVESLREKYSNQYRVFTKLLTDRGDLLVKRKIRGRTVKEKYNMMMKLYNAIDPVAVVIIVSILIIAVGVVGLLRIVARSAEPGELDEREAAAQEHPHTTCLSAPEERKESIGEVMTRRIMEDEERLAAANAAARRVIVPEDKKQETIMWYGAWRNHTGDETASRFNFWDNAEKCCPEIVTGNWRAEFSRGTAPYFVEVTEDNRKADDKDYSKDG